MTVAELEEQFGMPGALAFEESPSGLISAKIRTPAATATIYLQGAHLTGWQPAGHAPVLFLSAKSDLAPGKAIRGGVPVIFPWFGPRHDGKTGASHGFARTEIWQLKFAALAGDEMHLTWTLEPNEVSRSLGFDHFRVVYEMTIGRRLTLKLTVANDSGMGGAHTSGSGSGNPGAPLVFEEAFHTYFAVAEAEKASINGLGGAAFLDKRDAMKRKLQPNGAMHLTGATDRVYLATTSTCVLRDEGQGRRIVVEKEGSTSTVVWNPWQELTAKMADMEPDGWHGMMCVETANVGDSAITLAPGATHTMQATITIEALADEGQV